MTSERLAGKTALITGIGGGIGRAAAIRFAAEGAKVVGCDLNPETAMETREIIKNAGGEMTAMGGIDLGEPEAARSWVDQAAETYGGIDILYNNASAIKMAPIERLAPADWDFTIRNELNLVFYTTRAAWPHMIRNGGASIITMGSIAAMRGVEFIEQNAHSAAKGGVMALTLQFVVEGGPHHIRANCISPGLVRTPATAPLLESPPPRLKSVVLDRIPLGRPGEPDDIANAALFLASDESRWMSGANLVVDGGISVLG